jgi:hypothetical protein
LTCVILWCIHINVCNPYRDNESRGITLSKTADQNQIRTWPAHSYDKPIHAIWILYMHPNKSYRECKLKISIFSKFKRGNSVKNQWTITKFELDLRIPMTNLHAIWTLYIHPNKR